MAKIFVYFVLALALQICLVEPEAPQKNNVLVELVDEIKEVADSLSKTIKDTLPETERITKVLKAQSQEFATNVKNIVSQLKAAITENKGPINDAIKQASEQLAKIVSNFETAAGPEAAAHIKQLKAKLNETLKIVADEMENLVNAVQPNLKAAGDQINTLAKTVLNQFVESARRLQTKVNEALNAPQAGKQ